MRKRAHPIIEFVVAANDNHIQTATGRAAETLLTLVTRGEAGVTVFDFKGGPAYRLSAYIAALRDIPLSIITVREEHDCGWHARYVLHTTVRIISVKGAANDN
jgi:hypothetical protein